MPRIGFVTCVRLGLSCMEAIYEIGGLLDVVITLRDELAPSKAGRVYLDAFCTEHRIRLLKIRNINDPEAVAQLRMAALDWLFIIGWSQIAREEVLAAPRLGALGMHPTLLPEGRGRAAVPWAILKGLKQTGVSLFRLDSGVDTGPIVAQVPVPIAPSETAGSLYAKINEAHRLVLVQAWPGIARGQVTLHPQDEGRASNWPARTPEDGRIDLGASVADAERLVRATTRPYPGAYVDTRQGRLRIWAASVSQPGAFCAAAPTVHCEDGRWLVPLVDGWLQVDEGMLEPVT